MLKMLNSWNVNTNILSNEERQLQIDYRLVKNFDIEKAMFKPWPRMHLICSETTVFGSSWRSTRTQRGVYPARHSQILWQGLDFSLSPAKHNSFQPDILLCNNVLDQVTAFTSQALKCSVVEDNMALLQESHHSRNSTPLFSQQTVTACVLSATSQASIRPFNVTVSWQRTAWNTPQGTKYVWKYLLFPLDLIGKVWKCLSIKRLVPKRVSLIFPPLAPKSKIKHSI